MRRATFLISCGALLCGACGGGAAEPSQSLVGAQALPSQDDLAREAFYIVRGAARMAVTLSRMTGSATGC